MSRKPAKTAKTQPAKAAPVQISYVESLPEVGERLDKILNTTTLIIVAANGADECIGVSEQDVLSAILALAQEAHYEARMLESHLPADVLNMDAPNDDQARAMTGGGR